MHSTASFIVIFSVWIAGIVLILYYFLPSIATSRSAIKAYDSTSKDTSLRQEMNISDKSYISFSPLGVFDIFDN